MNRNDANSTACNAVRTGFLWILGARRVSRKSFRGGRRDHAPTRGGSALRWFRRSWIGGPFLLGEALLWFRRRRRDHALVRGGRALRWFRRSWIGRLFLLGKALL